MKKRLLFTAVLTVVLTVSSYAQSSGPNPENQRTIVACDLNLPLLFPSYNSQCAVAFSDLTIPEIVDSCGNTVTPTTDMSIFPITATGTTTIVWEFTNELGGIETANQNINILDFILPVPDVAILPNFVSQCAVQVADLPVPTATDNCSAVTVTNNAVFPITASTLITWTYTDATGNQAYQDQDIYIDDFTEPVPDVAVLPNVHALCQVNESDLVVPTATDNCGGLVTVTHNATFPILRSTLITWFYTDENGNVSYQDQDIYIDDFDAPVADAVSLPDFHALCQVDVADLPVPTATDNCSVASVTNDGIFPILASTTITWTFADPSGNEAVQTQQIIIDDVTNPVPDVAVLADVVSECPLSATDLVMPTATDNCSIASVTNDGVFPIAASTMITWTFADYNGNSATQTQNIIINDTTAPTPDAIVLADVLAQCELVETDLVVPTATDNCSGVVTVSNDGVFPITASTTLNWIYVDANGNSYSQSQNIIIDDTLGPTPDLALLTDVTAECELFETDLVVPSATDNCSGVASITNDGTFPITASTTLIWTYTDGDGNTSTQTQNVVINDVTAPTPDAIALADIITECEVLEADLMLPTATDNCAGIVTVSHDGVFPVTNSTTITWTYTDTNGNAATQEQNIVISDAIAPTPDAIALADITAECQVLEADVMAPTATDNCSAVVVTHDATFPITTSTIITWTFTDANGNASTQAQNVVINDTTAPTPDAAVLTDVISQCAVLEADLTVPSATDNCSTVTVTNDGVFPMVASTTITWTYTDASGNSDSQTQNIIVNDNTAPTPDLADLADVNGQCEILDTDLVAPTATDNCAGLVTVSNDGIFPITATTTIIWKYTDANGNSATQPQNIIIDDTAGPTPDVAVLADFTAECQVLETDLTVPSATDNCSGVASIVNDGVFPITVSTTLTWTYTDGDGNTSTQTQNVIISDTNAPTPDVIALADVNGTCEVLEADVAVPTATDNCSAVTVSHNATFPITASTTITWTYADVNGNSVTQDQNIVITDTVAPTPDAAVLTDVTAECQLLEADLIVPTATDNCSVASVTNDGIFPITASTTITWTYADVNGNTATQTQSIVINDTTAPTPDAAVLADITAQCQVDITDITAPTATDNCSGTVTVTNDAIFPIVAQGVTTINWTYTDASGNSTTQTQDVLIGDNTPPTVTLTDTTVAVDVTGNVTVAAAQLENGTAADNCGIASISVFPNAFDCTELGDHVVTMTILDIHGNVTTQTATVTVTDPSNFCEALGIDQNDSVALTLYPNPTSDLIYLQGNNLNIRSVSVYSISGQLIQSESYQQSAEQYSVSLKALPQGMYLLKFQTSEGTFTRRVMKY